MMDIDSEQ